MKPYSYYEYVEFDGAKFFTAVLLPDKDGSFPVVICRTPYVSASTEIPEEKIVNDCQATFSAWLERGYAVVYQHCRGQGKSTGAFIPYVHEREDGLFLRQWIRTRSFYNGELFLVGGSYTASLHYATAPFESDVKGAVFEVQDSQRYRLWYRNGQMRKGHANWHFGLYKSKCKLNKRFTIASFSDLPLRDLSIRALGDKADDFEEMLSAPSPDHEFWSTRNGGADASAVIRNIDIPVLFSTGYNDFYVGGVFKMWNSINFEARAKCALLVSPYDHGDSFGSDGLSFPNGKRAEQFGSHYQIDWLDNIRNGKPLPYEKGKITYYRAFENGWASDFYAGATRDTVLALGKDTLTFEYDPIDPPSFCAEGKLRHGNPFKKSVLTLYTSPLDTNIFVKGQMRLQLSVSSSCEDTSFYASISIEKPQGDYVLRHDINSLCFAHGEYVPDTEVELELCFDEYAFLLKRGERLRIDISSTDNNTYVCHTNKRGPYHLQDSTKAALNTVYLSRSRLILPTEIQPAD